MKIAHMQEHAHNSTRIRTRANGASTHRTTDRLNWAFACRRWRVCGTRWLFLLFMNLFVGAHACVLLVHQALAGLWHSLTHGPVCTCVCMYTIYVLYVYVYDYVHESVYIHVYVYIYVCVCVYVSVYAHVNVQFDVNVHVYSRIHVPIVYFVSHLF